MTRRSRIIGLLLPLVFLAPAAAFADQVCDTLYAQLRAPPRVIGNTAEVRRYANALARQNIVIRKIRNDLRGYGCSSGSVIVYGNPNAGLCAEIGDALADAEAERGAIIRDRDDAMAAARSDDGDIRRQRILAALDANGCSPAEDMNPQASPAPDVTRYPDAFRQGGGEPGQAGLSPYPNAAEGGLRTLCVRTCDGSFFPIASNASPLDFRAQAEQCQKMCPGTETELYFHSMADQETADMVSAQTGKPYKDLPTAFAYRNSSAKAPGCACNMAAYHQDMQKQEEAARPESEKPYSGITTIPSPQGDRSGDKAEKPAEQQQAAKPPEQPVPERDYDPNDSRVRVIGPKFLPDQTGRIDLKNPALKGIQPQQ